MDRPTPVTRRVAEFTSHFANLHQSSATQTRTSTGDAFYPVSRRTFSIGGSYSDEVTQFDEVVGRAERIIFRSKMKYLEEAALDRLLKKSGLAYTPLVATSLVTYIVAHDGRHIGRLRRETTSNGRRWWYALPTSEWCSHLGPFATLELAAEALSEHAFLFD